MIVLTGWDCDSNWLQLGCRISEVGRHCDIAPPASLITITTRTKSEIIIVLNSRFHSRDNILAEANSLSASKLISSKVDKISPTSKRISSLEL